VALERKDNLVFYKIFCQLKFYYSFKAFCLESGVCGVCIQLFPCSVFPIQARHENGFSESFNFYFIVSEVVYFSMSGSATPVTSVASHGDGTPDQSTQPSSPLEPTSPSECKDQNNTEEGEAGYKMDDVDDDDLEGMDTKAKALTNLLKTSSVGLLTPFVCEMLEYLLTAR
jgi:hypothetical protein